MKEEILYFDYAATTPCAPEVADAIYSSLKVDKIYGNASSAHALGYEAEQIIQGTRSITSKLINCLPENVLFTSGATESNNLALIGLSEHLKATGRTHIVTATTEHKAVLDTVQFLEKIGHKTTLIDPNIEGLIATNEVELAIQSDTGLVSIMHVNNETGVIQDITKIGELAHQHRVIFHVDAAQSAGKLKIDVEAMNIDLLSICAHKFYGPKGIGALYINPQLRSKLAPQLHGGGQEGKLRPGTHANHQIIGLSKTIELALDLMEADFAHTTNIRKLMLDELEEVITHINGSDENCLPGILNVSLKGVNSTTLLTTLQNKVALATGSACNSGTVSPSHVLMAMGIKGNQLDNAIRISFGRYTTKEQAKRACLIIKTEVERINSLL